MTLTVEKATQVVTAALAQMPLEHLRRAAKFADLHPARVLLDGHICDGDCYCPMVAGLSTKGIVEVTTTVIDCSTDLLVQEYGPEFDVAPLRYCDSLRMLNIIDIRTILRTLIAEASA